ncbi:hypothetical protein TNCV_2217601 [Trichonephila clavipes]|nr:hypothetical protein TNCV_2217601 [Trichonephila clavipes]
MAFSGHRIECRTSGLWPPRLPDLISLDFSPVEPSQRFSTSMRSEYANGLSCSSACCLYFGGHQAAETCALIHSTASSSVPRYTRCQVIYSQFGLAIHQTDYLARRRFVEWAPNEIAVVPDFHKRILFSDKAHFWLNGYVNKQNCLIWSEANPQVYIETPLHPEKLTVWCPLWAGGILLQKR